MNLRKFRAFSLIELLVVVAVIGIIATFAIPAVSGVLKGNSLTTASSMLVDQLSLARQHSLSKNRIVEVRFYRMADPEIPGEIGTDPTTGHYRAFQFFELSDAGVIIPASKVLRFPDSIIMNPGEVLSNLLGEDEANRRVKADQLNKKVDPELPRNVAHNYDYLAFRYFPDGTTSLSPTGTTGKPSQGGRWFITIHAISDLPQTKDNTEPPANFVTWMIDPVSGTSKLFRPGLQSKPPAN